jgi:hypothetical protein
MGYIDRSDVIRLKNDRKSRFLSRESRRIWVREKHEIEDNLPRI